MNIIIGIVILILVLIVGVLSITLRYIIKRATYLSDKEKEFLDFAIDIYINYADELNISDTNEHTIIVDNLKKIRDEKL